MGKFLWNLLESIIHFFLYKVFRLNLSEERYNGFLQFVKFGLVGLMNTVVNYAVYAVSLLLMEAGNLFPRYDYIIAQVIAFLISVLSAFYFNRKYVFVSDDVEKESWPKALLKTYISYASTGLVLSNVLLYIWIDLLGIPKLIAPVINLLATVPLNYILNKFWAFRGKNKN